MEALVVRLSQLDSQAEGALRIVMFYDTLMRRRVDLAALTRASAGLAERVAGIRLDGSGRVIRMAPDGRPAAEPAEAPTITAPITLDAEEIGTVWLERPDASVALDEVLLDRFAIAAASVVERYGPANTSMADPALVELAISAGGDAAARARAIRLLGFASDLPLQIAAVTTTTPLDQVSRLVSPGRLVKAAPIADVGVIMAAALDAHAFPADARAGIGAAESPDKSWREARTALRFTSDRQPVVHHADLGALALLAQVPPEYARDNSDVAAVARLATSPDDLETLEAYCASGSLRRAAELLHLHHSSVSRRLELIGKALDTDLSDPSGLIRARLALITWRLLQQP